MPTQVSLLDGALASAGTLAIQTNGTTSAITISSAQVATFVNNPIMTGLTASRAVFTDGSKGLTSNAITGTGNVVMSASPTLTGTIDGAALTLSSSLTLSGGTANGVLYLNGSKVATSGSALTFDGTNLGVGVTPTYPLDVSRGSSGVVARFASTSGAGAFVYADSSQVYYGAASGVPNCFVINNGSNYVALNANGSEGARLTSTGLGIGTSSPAAKLHVNGSFGTTATGAIRLTGTGQTTGDLAPISFYLQSSGWGTVHQATITAQQVSGSNGGANLLFGTSADGSASPTTRMTLDSSGNLGLGVTPSAWGTTNSVKGFQLPGVSLWGYANTNAYLNANSYFNGSNRIYVTSSYATEYAQTAGQHQWYTAPSGTAGNAITFTQAMTLDASGNLLVGQTSSIGSYKLQVNGIIYAGNAFYVLSQASGGGSIYEASGNTGIALGDTANVMRFTTGGTERARIDSSGNLLLGVTAQLNSEKQYIYQSANGIGLQINCVNASQTDYCFRIRAARNTTNGTFNAIAYYNDGASAYKFNVADSGNVTNTNNSYGAISDIKLKENIVDATPKLAGLMQVRVQNYNLKSDPEHKQLGVIAQELEQVFPGMVEESPDRDADGNDLGTTTKQVKYSVFVPMLIKAIQEQQAIIVELKARLDAANL